LLLACLEISIRLGGLAKPTVSFLVIIEGASPDPKVPGGFMQKLAISGAFAMLLLTAATAVQAREYPWCARYDWTTANCGFVTFQQCLATISGIGGRCEPNPRYVPPKQRRR
jgi:hypothetical protein